MVTCSDSRVVFNECCHVTRYRGRRRDIISWRVEWIFTDAADVHFTDLRCLHAYYMCERCNIVILIIRVCEDTPLKVLLEKYLHPTDSDPVIRHRWVNFCGIAKILLCRAVR